jgi:hypothetical protein
VCQWLGLKYYVPVIGLFLAQRDSTNGGVSWRVYDTNTEYHREYKVVSDGSPLNMGSGGMASPRREAFFLVWHVGWALFALHVALRTVVPYVIAGT